MKKSALKEAIKNEIKSVLSENQMTTDEAFRILRDTEDNLLGKVDPSHIQLMGLALDHLQAGEITRMMSDEERESKLQQAMRGGGKEEPLRKLAAIGAADVGLTESLNPEVSRAVDRFITAMADRYGYSMQDAVYAIMAALKQRNYDGLNEVEDMDDDEMDKAAAKSAKKGDSITVTSNKLQKLTAKMKKKAKEFKEAEGKAKDKLKDELKDMTAEKKELEKSL